MALMSSILVVHLLRNIGDTEIGQWRGNMRDPISILLGLTITYGIGKYSGGGLGND